jgi:hypothetical protein
MTYEESAEARQKMVDAMHAYHVDHGRLPDTITVGWNGITWITEAMWHQGGKYGQEMMDTFIKDGPWMFTRNVSWTLLGMKMVFNHGVDVFELSNSNKR